MARPGPKTRGQLHVGRYLGVLLLILAALYTVVGLAGRGSTPLTPKLGLDLQGGASVILEARPEPGQRVTTEQLDTAVNIIRQRVNGSGVSEAEVVTQGDNIVVSVPGGNRDTIRNVAQTAQLRFREVLQTDAGTPGPATDPAVNPAAPDPAATSTPSAPAGGSASPAPSAGATTSPSADVQPRALPPGLLAAASPTPAPAGSAAPAPPAPAAPVPATPAPATPAASAPAAGAPATPAPAPGDAGAGGVVLDRAPGEVLSGDAGTPENFAKLDCSLDKNRRGVGAGDRPDQQIVACDRDGSAKYLLDVAKVVGTDVKGATAQLPQTGAGSWEVLVSFTGEGQDKFTRLTQETVDKQVGIVLDGVVQSAPTIQTVINSDAQISGSFTQSSAQQLANVLKFGALPLTFVPQQEEVVSPTLGTDQLRSGLIAGGIGLLAVVIYSLLYYRALGIVTVLSLVVSGLLTYAAVAILGQQIGFALSLAGIAGFIVAVGITADSFVVYFERLKDEIKEGRTPRSAVDRAWVRARRTILSADTVSLLAAVILYFFAVGNVRGFAFTLGLSTLLDVVVVFLFTRPLVSWLSRFAWFSRSGPTGFHGPDGGEPLTRVAPVARRATPTTVQEA